MIKWAIFTLILTLLNFQSFAFDEQGLARSLGLELVSEGHPFNYLGINNVYSNDDLDRQMLVVSNVPGELKEIRTFEQKGFLILEIPKSDSAYVSMALIGITVDEVKMKLKTTSVWQTILHELNPLPRAYAETNCDPPGTTSFSSIEELQRFFNSGYAKGALTCLSSVLQGVWDSTGGRVTAAWDGLKNLVSDPRGFWNDKVQQMKNLANFIQNFGSKMSSMLRNFAGLPAETKTQIICGFVGGLGTDIAMTILTAGAMSGNLALKLESYLSKVSRLSRVMEVLNRVGKLREIPPKFFQALSSSKIPNSTLNNLNIFAAHNMPEIITGAISCAL